MNEYDRGFADAAEAAAKLLLRANEEDAKSIPGDSMVRDLVAAIRRAHADEILALATPPAPGDKEVCSPHESSHDHARGPVRPRAGAADPVASSVEPPAPAADRERP